MGIQYTLYIIIYVCTSDNMMPCNWSTFSKHNNNIIIMDSQMEKA